MVIAARIKEVLNQIIHQDQAEFLPKRHMRNNVRMILNVLENYDAHPEKQLALIFLHAEKAFDNVNWNFMLEMLQVLNVGRKFQNKIEAIYTKQTARIRINGGLTEEIELIKVRDKDVHFHHYCLFGC